MYLHITPEGSNLLEKYSGLQEALVNDCSTVTVSRNYANICGRFHLPLKKV